MVFRWWVIGQQSLDVIFTSTETVTESRRRAASTMGMRCRTVLEAGGLWSQCWQGRFLLPAMRKICSMPLSELRVPWLIKASSQHLPSRSSESPGVHVRVLISSFDKGTNHIGLGHHPTPE